MERLTKRTELGSLYQKPNVSNRELIDKLGEYEDLEEQGMLLKIPQIAKGKTLYWIWGDEIMPVIFRGVERLVFDKHGKYHVMCKMVTKRDRAFVTTYRRRTYTETIKAGAIRYFYADGIDETIFLDKEKAKTALAAIKKAEATGDVSKN